MAWNGRQVGETVRIRIEDMAERELKRKSPEGAARTEESTSDTGAVPAQNEAGEKIKAELDDLLDEIDEVLEENAEEFVRSYVQKGGE